MSANNSIRLNYSDTSLRILIEEYITQQRGPFTLKDACSYVLYWAIEEGKAARTNNSPNEGNKLCQDDSDRIHCALEKIAGEGRIVVDGEQCRRLE